MIKIDTRTKQKTDWKRNANPFAIHHFQCESLPHFFCLFVFFWNCTQVRNHFAIWERTPEWRKKNELKIDPYVSAQSSNAAYSSDIISNVDLFRFQFSSASNNELEMKYILDWKQFHWARNSLKQDIANTVVVLRFIQFSFVNGSARLTYIYIKYKSYFSMCIPFSCSFFELRSIFRRPCTFNLSNHFYFVQSQDHNFIMFQSEQQKQCNHLVVIVYQAWMYKETCPI